MTDLTQPTLGGWLVHVLREADSALSFEESLHAILDSMKTYFPAQSVAVVLVDEDTNEVRIKMARQISYSFAKEFRRKAPGEAIHRLLLSQEPLLVPDVRAQPAYREELKLEHDFDSAVVAPIVKSHRSVGYIFCDRLGSRAFNEADQLHLQVIGFLIGQLMVKFELLQERKLLSHTDDATGALKYAAFVSALGRELQRAVTHDYAVAVAMVRLPAFRSFLDMYGIDRAHRALADVVKIARRHMKDTDLMARFSADQFVVCLSGLTADEARRLFEALRADVAREVGSETPIAATLAVSVLVLGTAAAKKRPLQDLMGQTGKALLEAAAGGDGGLKVVTL